MQPQPMHLQLHPQDSCFCVHPECFFTHLGEAGVVAQALGGVLAEQLCPHGDTVLVRVLDGPAQARACQAVLFRQTPLQLPRASCPSYGADTNALHRE